MASLHQNKRALLKEKHGPKGGKMLEVTEKASEMIKDFLKGREKPHSIRILMSAG
jgi:hypothetical protein